ncbi:MAG TPA: hypothetical protein VHV83_21870 [Armatimonadota bacterium]|nr:hypothetical protein [Armatimonadota bacterium]
MQSLKIVVGCIAAAILYGIVHDQFTARICLEYFTVFHPPVFPTQSPTLLGIGWGIIATWWMGAFLGVLIAIAARAGSRPKLTAEALVRPIVGLLVMMATLAVLCGVLGFVLARNGSIQLPEYVAAEIPKHMYQRFMADWWAHNASYAGGFIGGIVLCATVYRKRVRLATGAPVQG